VEISLKELHFDVKAEHVDHKSGYSIDLIVSPPKHWMLEGERGHENENVYAVEVDGPGHFARPDQKSPLGSTVCVL
jgi:hypothetical protein